MIGTPTGRSEALDSFEMVPPSQIDRVAARLAHEIGPDCVSRDIDLSPLCTYRVGGAAALAITPRTIEELAGAVRVLAEAGCSFDVLGQGSNVLVSDRGSTTPVIVTTALDRIELEGVRLKAQAGAACTRLAGAALGGGLTGLEFFHCLPGSAGGAAFMNGRAFGQEVAQVIEWADVITREGEIERISLCPKDFGYKHSPFMDHPVVIARVGFRLEHAPRNEIRAMMESNEKHRRCKGEMDHPSCGCVFRNDRSIGISAGALVDSCDLKGLRLGGAWVSHKHANFIVHSGKATASQIRQLMDKVRDTVRRKTGHLLDYEVRFMGDW
jgi:UDP-N-acetylmuramate dehydrogenase